MVSDVTARKAERLMNLTICLLVTRHHITKERIRQAVEGYHDLSDDAFDRMFDRDKEELRVLGVPIEVAPVEKGFEDDLGYRIRRADFELPEVTLSADEVAVVGLAARVWQHARLAAATSQALRKLRAGGVEVDESTLAMLEPALGSVEPQFDALLDAIVDHHPIAFDYRAPNAAEPVRRRLDPWGIASWHGHWYLVGHDQDRDAPRMFRVSRMVGDVEQIGQPGSVVPPADLNVRELVSSLAPERPHSTATVLVREGRGGPLRRRSTSSEPADEGWRRLKVPYASGASLAEELLGFGPDVIVEDPPELRESVVRRLQSLVGGPA